MLDAVAIQKLSQKIISADADKVKERIDQAWTKASSEEKKNILELSGSSRTTPYRVAKTGSLNLRLAVAFAQVLNVNPRYLAGEVDTRGTCSKKNLNVFLAGNGVSAENETESSATAESEMGDTPKVSRRGRKKTVPEAAPMQAEETPQIETTAETSGLEIPVVDETPVESEAGMDDNAVAKVKKPRKSPGRKAKKDTATTPVSEEADSLTGEQKQMIEERFDQVIRESLKQTADEYKLEQGIPLDDASESEFDGEASDTILPIENNNLDVQETISPETQKFMDTMTEDEMLLLLKAVLLRAKANVPDAVEAVAALKRLLLLIN